MFGLFWSVLNLALFVSFIYFFFKVVRMGMRQMPDRQRLLAAPVLTIGLIALLAGKGESTAEKKQFIGADFAVEYKTIALSRSESLNLRLVRSRADGQIDQVLSDSYLSGFVLGRTWIHQGINEKDGQIQILGHMKYRLLGWEIMGFSRDVTL